MAKIDLLKRIAFLIEKEATGTPKELATKLHIAESTVYNYLNILKDLGAPIQYRNTKQSYCYSEKGTFKIKFEKKLTL